MPRLIGIEQNTASWVVARVGCHTASYTKQLMTKGRNGMDESTARESYREEKLTETITGEAENHGVKPWMVEGLNLQPYAKTEYELRNGVFVEPGGLWMHDRLHRFRASPDYLVPPDGLLECKCPTKKVQLRYATKHQIPKEHQWQMLAQMSVTGRRWVDWVSYCPKYEDDNLQYIQIRFKREDKGELGEHEALIRAIEVEVGQLLKEIDQAIEFLGVKPRAAAACRQEELISR